MFKTEIRGAILGLTIERAPMHAYPSDMKTMVVTPPSSPSSRRFDG